MSIPRATLAKRHLSDAIFSSVLHIPVWSDAILYSTPELSGACIIDLGVFMLNRSTATASCCVILYREYEALIPDTWHVVNDADIIPRVGKFLRMYKRPGQRVIIDRRGSLVVRPSPLELHLRPCMLLIRLSLLAFSACYRQHEEFRGLQDLPHSGDYAWDQSIFSKAAAATML